MASIVSPPQCASSDPSVDARARELLLCATRRWLVKDELVFLLLHHKQQTAVPCLRVLQPRPMSGTLVFYDTNEVSDFKKDGWRWQKRKDNSGRVREDRAKLVINREVIILGTYVHSAEIPTFHRRNYYLRDSKQQVMLVHYFDEANKTDPAMGLLVPSKAQPLPRVIPILPVYGKQSPSRSLKRTLSQPTTPLGSSQPTVSEWGFKADPYSEPVQSVDAMMKDCLALDYHTSTSHTQLESGGPSSGAHLPQFEVDDTLFSELSGLLSPSNSSHSMVQSSASAAPTLIDISDFSPGWDFIEGGAKILFCLAAPLSSVETPSSMSLFVRFGTHSRSPAELLSDTVIRCSAPPANSAGPVEIFLCFSSSGVSPDYVQVSTSAQFQYKSVLTSPAPTPAPADETLSIEVRSLPLIPEPAVSSSGKRGRSPGARDRLELRNSSGANASDGRRWSNPDCGNLSAFVDTDLDERQCKIRVVERLAEFQDAIRTTSNITDIPNLRLGDHQEIRSSDVSSSFVKAATESDTNAALDDGAIEALSDQDLESLSEQLIENVVRQLVTVAHTSEELLEELNSLDETGLSLLHYVSFYNYSHLIPLLLSHGAQVNQQSTQGQTPLHLAAGCGHGEVVSKLLEAGADVFALDFDGTTPAERAEKSGHTEVSQHLRKLMGDTTVLESSLETETSPGGMWKDTAEEMEIDDNDNSGLFSSQERSALTPESPSVESEMDSGTEQSSGTTTSSRSASYVGENHEHNRKLLLGAFSTMSLHDKCALSLSISRDLASSYASAKRRGSCISDDGTAVLKTQGSSSASSPGKGSDFTNGGSSIIYVGVETEGIRDSDVKSVIADDEENLNKLGAAMELMGPEEIQSLEEEARVIQSNVRAWLLRRNCRNMRETTKRLHEAAKNIEDQQKQQDEKLKQNVGHHFMSEREMSERERAAVTVQAAARSMLARKSFLQTRNVTIKVQAATRGVLCRKNFARMKTHALASLVIQRNVREWLSKQPSSNEDRLLTESTGDMSSYVAQVDENVSSETSNQRKEKCAREEEDEALMRELNEALDIPAMGPFLSS